MYNNTCLKFLNMWVGSQLLMGKSWVSFFVQLLSRVWLFVIPWTVALQVSLSFTISWSLLKLMSIESVMPSNHLAFCHPLLSSTFPNIGVFSNESALRIRWPKYWSFSFSISPSNEYSWLISFRIDWFNLLAVQGSLLHSFKNMHFNPSLHNWVNKQIKSDVLNTIEYYSALKRKELPLWLSW